MALRRPGAVEGPSRAEGPSTEVPLAIWYLEQLAPASGSDRESQTARDLCSCSLNGARSTAEPHSSAFGGISGAHYMGRTGVNRKPPLGPRAHPQIQTLMQTGSCDRKPSGLNLKFRPDGLMFHVKHSIGTPTAYPIPPHATPCCMLRGAGTSSPEVLCQAFFQESRVSSSDRY